MNMDTFLKTIQRMYPIVKGLLGEMCDAAEDEMKQMAHWGRGHVQ